MGIYSVHYWQTAEGSGIALHYCGELDRTRGGPDIIIGVVGLPSLCALGLDFPAIYSVYSLCLNV